MCLMCDQDLLYFDYLAAMARQQAVSGEAETKPVEAASAFRAEPVEPSAPPPPPAIPDPH